MEGVGYPLIQSTELKLADFLSVGSRMIPHYFYEQLRV